MKKIYVILIGVLMISIASAQTFMTEEELMSTFPGATISGISNTDGKTKWSLTIGQPKKAGKKKGKYTGVFGGDETKGKWYIKKGKWCDNWGSGKDCWDIERVDATTFQPYKKGEALNIWNLGPSG